MPQTTHSGRPLGRVANDPTKPRLSLDLAVGDATLATTIPTPPATVDWYSKIPPKTIGMDENDNIGCCTIADQDHVVKAREIAAGNPEIVSTGSEIIAIYSAVSGYDPSDPSTDQGAMIQDVLNYGVKTGFKLGGTTHKLAAFASIGMGGQYTTQLIQWATWQFRAVHLGINFPASADDQFSAGQPWDVVAGSEIEGGHDIPILGYDGTFYYVATWGAIQRMTPAFLNKYGEEAWASISTELANSVTATDPLGQTLYALGQQWVSMKPGNVNPFPLPPTPTPTPPVPVQPPAPTPVTPTPGPDALDVAFWQSIKGWAQGKKTLPANRVAAAQVLAWAKNSGLS